MNTKDKMDKTKEKRLDDWWVIRSIRKLSEKGKAEYSSVVTVGEMEIEGIPTDYRDVAEGEIVRYFRVVKLLFARPFIDAPGTGARAPKLNGAVFSLGVVGPLNRYFAVAFFDYLCRLDHQDFNPASMSFELMP